METPYLNDKINDLEIHLRNDELSTLGKEHLTEFKNIKEQLALCSVVGQSEQLKAVEELVDFARDVTNVCDLDRLEEILDRL